jgi:hypothetical protein
MPLGWRIAELQPVHVARQRSVTYFSRQSPIRVAHQSALIMLPQASLACCMLGSAAGKVELAVRPTRIAPPVGGEAKLLLEPDAAPQPRR